MQMTGAAAALFLLISSGVAEAIVACWKIGSVT